MASLLLDCLLRDFLATFPHDTPLAFLLSFRDLAMDDIPAHCCVVLTEAPFLELPLVLALAMAVSAACFDRKPRLDIVLHYKLVGILHVVHGAPERFISGDVQGTECVLVRFPTCSHLCTVLRIRRWLTLRRG